MFQFLNAVIKPLAFPAYCICTLTLIALFLWSICKATKDGIERLQRLHQIPCAGCAFFTGDYRLKCTVHPVKALSEEALGCLDYEPTASCTATVYEKWSKHFGWSMPANHTACNSSSEQSCLRANSQ